jgi:hypothetical protein
MNKEELILALNKITDFNKYSIKGGTSMFNREYPNLLDEINKNTIEIQVFSSNKKLVSKLLYLLKYSGDIKNIMYNNEIMIYDHKINDFKISCLNAAQKHWDAIADELLNISIIYSKEETVSILKPIYENYMGKSGNRKLMRDNKKLYVSLFHHTSHLDLLNKNLNKFSMRLYILVNNIDIYCDIHNTLKFWSFHEGVFKIVCGKCQPHYPTKEWFKKTYGNDWKIMLNKRKEFLSDKMVCSLGWYEEKHGKVLGREKYDKTVYNKMSSLANLKANRYSKISQDLFWKIYNQLNNKSNIYFAELNHEYVEQISRDFMYENSVMLHDFKQNNKIIEYNGIYWHNNVKDSKRYQILKKMGYEILVITSDEYRKGKMSEEVIDKCLNFLQC